ncbi:hypothetical protein DSECCO2_426770 [anaerobic digester metagenome]
MSEPDDNFVKQNNYNFALEEEFDYLDELSRELEARREAAEEITAPEKKENGSEENTSSKPLNE